MTHHHTLDAKTTAVVLVDVVNAFDFPEAAPLVEAAEKAAPRIRDLCARARSAGTPVLYVNDNFGRWRSDFRATLDACTEERSAGRHVSTLLRPQDDDYFVLKPMHSGFYSSALEVLLRHLETRTLVLAGFATDLCILFTAHDAYMRRYELYVPRDLTGSNSPDLTERALSHMRGALGVNTDASTSLSFA